MNRFYSVIIILLLISTFFFSFGYAYVSDELRISGSAESDPTIFSGVYICDVKVVSTSGLASVVCEYLHPTNLKTELEVSSTGATITYEITVHNNTDVTYWYLGSFFENTYGSNSLIGKTNGIFITSKDANTSSSGEFDTTDWVNPQSKRTFYVTYRFGSSARGNIQNLVNFKFGIHMDAVQDEFLRILNDKTSDNGYYYLSGEFDKKYSESGSTEIGNIGEDKAIFDRLFGENVTIDINGVETPVTIIVSRRNVDGKTGTGDSYSGAGSLNGCEYTVYITVDALNGSNATVYAVSYTCRDGVWYQIGELYEGTCKTEKYDSTNSGFDVYSWDATAKIYYATDDISYKVGYEQGTNFDKLDSIEELMSTNDQEFYNAVNNNSAKLLKPVCNTLYYYLHTNGQWKELDNPDNSYKPGYDELKIAFAKIKPYCYIGNGAQEVKIQNANSLTRAELIQLIEEVQHAYNYYKSVNGIQ